MGCVIAVFNQKGGCGKTTQSMHIAGGLANMGYKTAVIDMDLQGTASIWAAQSTDEAPFPASVLSLQKQGAKFWREAERLSSEFDVLVIDCPPALDSPIPSAALMIANLAIIPFIPAPADYWATQQAKELVREAWDKRDEIFPVLLVVNNATNTALARDTISMAAEDKHFPLALARFGRRTAFTEAPLTGQTVHALRGAKAAIDEADALSKEIVKLMKLSTSKKKENAHG